MALGQFTKTYLKPSSENNPFYWMGDVKPLCLHYIPGGDHYGFSVHTDLKKDIERWMFEDFKELCKSINHIPKPLMYKQKHLPNVGRKE